MSTTTSTADSSSSSSAASSKKVSAWLPISAVIGTSLAVAIPLIILRRQRRAGLHSALNSSPPPPRISRTSISQAPGPRASPHPTTSRTSEKQSESEFSSPGVGELISAVSKADLSSSLMAFKAFGIATCLVAVGAVTVTWSVKSVLGVKDAQEFGEKMRMTFWSALPTNLLSSIYRPPATDEERHDAYDAAPFDADDGWTWVEAEKRLIRAYDEGGFPLWARTAMREVEAEARVERVRRQREMDEKAVRRS
ncbi:hypothetical protein K443DRAFT_681803 [Laccaria amethystina LaAM-08-1]|uniref:Uncharacterized protein n=1 Tax=Laccaria amethystina LaAM-08-1 TaxID=1095629 RepID=A0A0C9WWT6_9AGAR|nr:hypothetical protein K443DRAFT_681803 [Laccaria amethystina LaAM-08-1]